MRIAFDLTPIYDHLTGVERYNINITKEIIHHHPENQYVLLFKNEIHKEFEKEVQQKNIEIVLIPECNKLLFIQWRLLRALWKIPADYYVFLSFTSPVFFKRKRIVNAIHDLTCWDFPETIPFKMKYYYRFVYNVAVKNSWKIVTVSKFSQKRICEKYGLSQDDISVVYDGLTDIFSVEPQNNQKLKEKYKLPEKYILSLSTIEPRKNLQLLIRAYIEMTEEGMTLPDLVLAGRKGWKLEDIVGDINTAIKSRIYFTGFVDDEDLPQIYREADLFVFPSMYEGFGLPVIEAMSQGTIVVCSNAASLPEVAQNAGIIFKSNDIVSLKHAITDGLNLSVDDRRRMKEVGIATSHSFSWKIEAEKLARMLTSDMRLEHK